MKQQPNKAIQPSKAIQPNKAIQHTGNVITVGNSSMPVDLDTATVIPIVLSVKGPINIQINNNITNNTTNNITNNITNNNSSETPNQGHQGASQGLQPTAPASRATENRHLGMGSVPSASNPTHTIQQRSENSIGGKADSSHTARVQPCPAQDTTRVGCNSFPTIRPATSQVPSWHKQEGTKSTAPTSVSVAHAQGQKHQKSQPKGNKQLWGLSSFFHSDHENGPQRKANASHTATRPIDPNNRGNHTNKSRESSAVQTTQGQNNHQAPHHQNQTANHLVRTSAPVGQARGHLHGEPQSRRQHGGVIAPQGQPAVNHLAGIDPGLAKELENKNIGKCEHSPPKL